MTSTAPIGVFDSGIGGLSVLRHLQRELPNEDLIYVADSGYAPYGERPAAEVLQRAETISRFLLAQGAKLIVIACNTATAIAAAALRKRLPLPVVGVEPGLKPASNRTRNGVIAILATQGTLKSAKYDRLVNRYGQQVTVISQVCKGLADLVEQGALHTAETHSLLQKYLAPIMEQRADTIVLGCTHYPFLIPRIRQIVGDGVEIIDTGAAVAKQVHRRLEPDLLHPRRERSGNISIYTSGDSEQLSQRLEHYWPGATLVSPLPIPEHGQS